MLRLNETATETLTADATPIPAAKAPVPAMIEELSAAVRLTPLALLTVLPALMNAEGLELIVFTAAEPAPPILKMPVEEKLPATPNAMASMAALSVAETDKLPGLGFDELEVLAMVGKLIVDALVTADSVVSETVLTAAAAPTLTATPAGFSDVEPAMATPPAYALMVA